MKYILPLGLAISVLSSCGTGKKLQTATAEIAELKSNIDLLLSKNKDQSTEISRLKSANENVVAEYSNYKKECDITKANYASAKEDLNEIEEYLEEQYDMLQEVEDKVEKAMLDFADKGVDVYYKDGFVYVSMSDQLLYKSGSATLGTDGKKALQALAAALNDYPKLKVVVVGNTDNVQFKTGSDNWTLSTERANGVIRILRDNYKVDASRMTAAGRGKYAPVADNGSAEGRAKNRRTEIVLNPDLVKIWQSLKD